MSESLWSAVDQFICDSLIPADPVLEGVLEASHRAGLPAIAVSPPQGKMLHLLARLIGARRILEIGTLGGYSTVWMARALPAGGKLVTLEVDAKHAQVALANFAKAGLRDVVELKQGPALESLPGLSGPFDMAFIDADKANIPQYFEWALKLSRPGALIVVDNVVREGRLADPKETDPNVKGVRRLHEMLAKETRVSATSIQTVGSKGHDGFTLALVKA